MKLNKRTLLIGGGLLLLASTAYGIDKAKRIALIFEKMDIEPVRVSNFKPDFREKQVSFYVDVKLTNNVNDDLFITGASVAKLSRLHLFYNRVFLGTAIVNITTISVPANNELIIKDIPVIVPMINALKSAPDLARFNPDLLEVTGEVTVLQKVYRIGEENNEIAK